MIGDTMLNYGKGNKLNIVLAKKSIKYFNCSV